MRPLSLYATVVDSPPGPFAVVFDDDGIAAADFVADVADIETLRRLLPAHRRDVALHPVADAGDVGRSLAAYFAGDLAAIDDLAVSASGTDFQQRAWAALREVPAGAPISYRELAARAGAPGAARAAGSACARNPVAVVVPCHRVVRADGCLGGYGGGVARKRWLLDHERGLAQAGVATETTARSRTKAAGRSPLLISTSAAASVR